MWMQDGCKVYMDSYMDGINWIMFHGHLDYFQNHLLEVCLTQNRKTMALQLLTTIDLLYLIMCEDPHE